MEDRQILFMSVRATISDKMNKYTKSTIAIVILFTCLIQGCKKPGCIGSAGPLTLQERAVSGFSKIELSDNIDLVLIQGDTEKIEICGPQNILPNIQTVVTGDLLTIANVGECRWLRSPDEKVTVKLYFKKIYSFDYKGSGNVTNEDTIRMEYLRFDSETGAGNIDLTVDVGLLGAVILKENASMIFHGKAGQCETYTNARGILNLSDMQVNNMNIIYSGLADTHINVSGSIQAYVRYKGNVYCKGNPTIIRQEYFSSGRLIMIP